jgi:hypothetical protein
MIHALKIQNKTVLIDSEDYDLIKEYTWNISNDGWNDYAKTEIWKGGRKKIYMHQLIMGTKGTKYLVDHKNCNGLDNRRSNLRICDNSGNGANRRIVSNNTSGMKGVSWNMQAGKWRVKVVKNGRDHHCGYFDDLIEGAKAYDKKAIELFGEFARTNKMMGLY